MVRRRRQPKKEPSTSGFTLVELSFAIAFFSILLIIITALISHVAASYQKGLTIKAVNSVGKTLVDDFTSSISASSTQNLKQLCSAYFSSTNDEENWKNCKNTKGLTLAFQEKVNEEKKQLYGAFCTGNVSYIWNTGYATAETGYIAKKNNEIQINSNSNSNTTPIRLLKANDPNRKVCIALAKNDTDSVSLSSTEELLSSSNQQLVLYDFTVFLVSQNSVTQSALYSGTFVLGTKTGNIDITASGGYCSVDDGTLSLSSDFSYCALNKFNFAAASAGA